MICSNNICDLGFGVGWSETRSLQVEIEGPTIRQRQLELEPKPAMRSPDDWFDTKNLATNLLRLTNVPISCRCVSHFSQATALAIDPIVICASFLISNEKSAFFTTLHTTFAS